MPDNSTLLELWKLVAAAPSVVLMAATTLVALTWTAAWRWYGSALSSKDARIGHLEERIKLRDDQLSGKFTTTSAEEAKALIEKLRSRVDDLPEPGLTASQRDELTKDVALVSDTMYSISFIQDEIVSDVRLGQLAKVFKTAGWRVILGGFSIGGADPPICGLVVEVSDPGLLTKPERIVLDAFRKANLKFETKEKESSGVDVVVRVSFVP